jgi:hypothetical protein
MATTDRVNVTNHQVNTTDRMGQVVTLGSAIVEASFSINVTANLVAGQNSANGAALSVVAAAVITMFNGSQGPWPVYWNPQPAATFSAAGATIKAADWSCDAVLTGDFEGAST